MENYNGTHYADSGSKSQHPYGVIKPPQNRAKFIDTHELLKQELILQGGAGGFIADGDPPKDQFRRYEYLTDISDKAQEETESKKDKPGVTVEAINKNLTSIPYIKDYYIYFDSYAKNSPLSAMANGRMSWSIPLLNQNQPLENIIEMELGSFYLPDIPTPATYPQYYFYERITMLLEETQAQSIRAQESIRFHWELDLTPAGISRKATPVNPKFIFQIPFRDLSTASFVIRAPIKYAQLEPDTMQFNSVPSSSPARIVTVGPHLLPIGSTVAVFVTNFLSAVSAVDTVINDPDGFLVTVIDANTLEFPPLATAGFDFALVGTVPGTVTIGFRRIAFTMRFRTLVDLKTNGITPV